MGLFDDVLDKVGQPYSGGKGFEYGTHKVLIGEATAKKDAKDRVLIEVVVFDKADNDKKATCTLWFHTDGAAKMSVTKVLGMLVHKVPEEKKDAVRELGKKLFGSVDDTTTARDIAAKLINDKLINEEAYLVAEPRGKYPTTSYGDLWHYAAEPQNPPTTVAVTGGEEVTDAFPEDSMPKFDGDEGDDL